jgi:expansin (peptidoglycan-binding protein)
VPRWVFPAAGVAVLATAATVLLIVRAAGASCPAVGAAFQLVAAGSHTGTATYYAADGGGNCSFDAAGAGLYVALGPSEYAAGAACGEYLDVTGPKGTVRVKVTDQCPECEPGHLDLSKEAFAKIGAVVSGVIPVTYRQVADPKLPAALTVRVKDGASRYWLALRIDNHGNPLRSVEVRTGSTWTALARADYNYWIKASGAGPGPFTLRLTDTAGHTATVSNVALAPQRVQQTGVWMYGAAVAGTGPPAVSRSASPAGSPSGSASASVESSASASVDPLSAPAEPSAPAPGPSRPRRGC